MHMPVTPAYPRFSFYIEPFHAPLTSYYSRQHHPRGFNIPQRTWASGLGELAVTQGMVRCVSFQRCAKRDIRLRTATHTLGELASQMAVVVLIK